MVVAFLVMTVIFTLGISLLTFAMTTLNHARRDVVRAQALSCAEAGVDMAEAWLIGRGPNGTSDPGAWRCTNYPVPIATNQSCKVTIEDGSGITAGKIVITSTGTAVQNGVTTHRTIQVVVNYQNENVNIWGNAIFAGVGQAGKSINGNVVIRGSVHILGDGETYTDLDGDGHWDDDEPYTDKNGNHQYDEGEPYTDTDGDGHHDSREPFVDANGNGTRDPALTVTDLAEELSGTANIGNNYSGMSTDLRGRIPAAPTETYAGETVESLKSKLRVKHGKVSLSGSATAGDPQVTGNGVKETLAGTYVSDGFGGNKGTANVNSDNGYTNQYDLADGLVTMPLVDSGSYTSGGVTYTNYLAYLAANATVVAGDLNVQVGTAKTITGPKGTLTMDASGNMTVTGIVYVTGNITFGPSKSRITYSGSGTLATPGNVYCHGDLVPKTRFPNVDALGLIAGNNIELATGGGDAQLEMALAMYAQHKIISNKQNEVAGTMVTSYFQMSNVPKLYQVPELAKHLPPGMPGSDPIYIVSLTTESWQEL
jgi:hypothetical protein